MFKTALRALLFLSLSTTLVLANLQGTYQTLRCTTIGDQFYSDTVLILNMTGANGSTVFTDQSNKHHGDATPIGNAAVDTSTSPPSGTGSAVFAGVAFSPDLLFYNPSVDWQLGTLLFTIEAFIYPTDVALGNRAIVARFGGSAPNLSWILFQNGSQLFWNVSTTGSNNLNDLSGGLLVAATWNPIAVDFDGTTYRLYVNGTMVDSSTTLRSIAATPSEGLAIGSNSDSNALFFQGKIFGPRITLNRARYATNGSYTVPIVPFPISAGSDGCQ